MLLALALVMPCSGCGAPPGSSSDLVPPHCPFEVLAWTGEPAGAWELSARKGCGDALSDATTNVSDIRPTTYFRIVLPNREQPVQLTAEAAVTGPGIVQLSAYIDEQLPDGAWFRVSQDTSKFLTVTETNNRISTFLAANSFSSRPLLRFTFEIRHVGQELPTRSTVTLTSVAVTWGVLEKPST
jgi:hypothetical protein